MKKTKIRLLLTTTLCGLSMVGAPSLAHAVITTTTTTTHSYDFPGSAPSVSSSSSTANNCPPAYSGGDGDGDGGDGGRTGGGYVDTDGDGRGDTWSGHAEPGSYNSSDTRGGRVDGNTNVSNSGRVSGSHEDGYEGRSSGGGDGGGGDGGGGGGCFVTTAVVRVMGEPDNGPTLTNLRRLRDNYTAHTADGAKRIEIYYAIAPEIVKRVDGLPDSFDIWSDMYENWISPISRLVKAERWEEADAQYMQMIKTMIWQYLIVDKRPVAEQVKEVISGRLGLSWA